MTFFPLYLSKIFLISGLLYGYYWFFLRNRLFHLYNRYFLLGIPVAALLLPLIPMPFFYNSELINRPDGVLHAIRPGDWIESAAKPVAQLKAATVLNWQDLTLGVYILIAGCLLTFFVRQLRYIYQLPNRYSGKHIGDIEFFMTNEPGTPFSFLKSIFWNEELETDSSRGEQIFQHELYHIRQKHTLDLLFLKPILILFWPNPFFHLIYREIRAIHEFLADEHAVSSGDKYQYAELLVWQTIRNPPASLLHRFFNSPIKRRITMITQNKTTRTGLTSRVMILPLFVLLFCAFTARFHPHAVVPGHDMSVQAMSVQAMSVHANPLTVIIDAGHGGIDPGTIENGLQEKDINLALALKIKELSSQYNVNVVLTRQTDELSGHRNSIRESLEYRTKLAAESRADLFVSIHVDNRDANDDKGFSIYLSRDNSHYAQCVKLGSTMIEALKGTYATEEDMKETHEHVYVLRNSTMPAILVSCGNIKNPKDRAFITNEQNQATIAQDILKGILQYQSRTTTPQ